MAKQVKVKDEVYGTMTLDSSDNVWKVKEKIIIPINNHDCEVGKEKANKLLVAQTKEERLESLVLKRMRVFRDRIEITCTCDWYRHSGGFSINSDGYAVMLSLDSMSI